MNFVYISIYTEYVQIYVDIILKERKKRGFPFPMDPWESKYLPTQKCRQVGGISLVLDVSSLTGHGRQHRFVVGHRGWAPGTHLRGAVEGCRWVFFNGYGISTMKTMKINHSE